MARLPYQERAILDIRKLQEYCLDPRHPRGRHKARLFQETLGATQDDARWLRQALLRALSACEATALEADGFGACWGVCRCAVVS